MEANTLLITSPNFIIRASSKANIPKAIDLSTGNEYEKINEVAFPIIFFFVTPRSLSSALSQGFKEQNIKLALEAGILIFHEDNLSDKYLMWERNNWSHASHIIFSQLNINYLEDLSRNTELINISSERREFIKAYSKSGRYPERSTVHSEHVLHLEKPSNDEHISLNALVRRRSTRSFRKTDISLPTLNSILFESTRYCRIASRAQDSGDEYYVLDSFYSWLNVYIFIQGVSDIDRGLYYYHPIHHTLTLVHRDINDDDVKACIQSQSWIGGGGFCLFIVSQWERYMWIYRHSRAYINLLIQVGEFGQEVLQSVYRHDGLGAWMTPAITETKASRLLFLDPLKQDAVYFIKVGYRI